MQSQNDRMISVSFQGKLFNITEIQVYALTSNWRSWSWMFLWRLTRSFRINTQKRCTFHLDWTTKVGSQEIPGVTGKFGLGIQNEAGQRLIELCQENTLFIANTFLQQHKEKSLHMDITRWPTLKSDWLYSLQPKIGAGNGTPLQHSCLENPMDGGAW